MPKRKLATPTKFDKQQQYDTAKLLVFAGHTTADAARMVGVEHGTVRSWSSKHAWPEEMARAQAITNRGQQGATIAARVAFDRAKTGKKNANLLAKMAHRTAIDTWNNMKIGGGFPVESAQDFKALVEATAKIHPAEFGEEVGKGFSVSLQLNSIVNSPDCRELTAEEISEYLED